MSKSGIQCSTNKRNASAAMLSVPNDGNSDDTRFTKYAKEGDHKVSLEVRRGIAAAIRVLRKYDPQKLKFGGTYREGCVAVIKVALQKTPSCNYLIMTGEKVVLRGDDGWVYLLPYLHHVKPDQFIRYNPTTLIEKAVCFDDPGNPGARIQCYVSTFKCKGDLFDAGMNGRNNNDWDDEFCDQLVYWLLMLACLLHDNDIAHFDVKPDNVLYDNEGVYAIDLSFAELVRENERTTKNAGTEIWVIDPHDSQITGNSYSAMQHQTWCFAHMIWWLVTRSAECDEILFKYFEKQMGCEIYETQDFEPFKARFPEFARMLMKALAPTKQADTRPLPDALRTAFKTEFKSRYGHEPAPANFSSFSHSLVRTPDAHE